MPYHDPFQQPHYPDRSARQAMPFCSQPMPGALPSHPRQSQIPHPRPAPPPPKMSQAQAQAHTQAPDNVGQNWFANGHAQRVNTDAYIYQLLKRAYPDVEILDTDQYSSDIAYYIANTGDGSIEGLSTGIELSALSQGTFELNEDSPLSQASGTDSNKGPLDSLHWIGYYPPSRRLDGGTGVLTSEAKFDSFLVKWHDHEFKIFIADCRDGTYPIFFKRQYILTAEPSAALALIKKVGLWFDALHNEIWVFDSGYWQKDPELFSAIQKSSWDDIILPAELKGDLLKTILRFYDSRDAYTKLRVPWKRGLIFYGPPGNGKTVSIKATMKTLFDRKESIPTLYVKSLKSFLGPEASISSIFAKARQQAPCYLVFEDLDSLVGDDVRSFFLNAVDGLSENEGILMVGSTNHLERLDPGIAKRPSRFDRKYLFPDPALAERKRYCQYWQHKLKDNDEVKFPDKLVGPIARLMDGFSFAYMQEAFISTLLKIANEGQDDDEVGGEEAWDFLNEPVLEDLEIVVDDKGGDDEDELDKYILWKEIKVQIANLRKELDRGQE